MTETLAGFPTYVPFESSDAAEKGQRFAEPVWQPALRGEGTLAAGDRRPQGGAGPVTFYRDCGCAEVEERRVVRRRLQYGYRIVYWQ